MHPAVRALGTLLRLVGISSPEDTAPHPTAIATEQRKPLGPPSWRSPGDAATPNPPATTSPPTPSKDNQPSV